VAGIQYKAKVWELQWPVIAMNTINACKKAGAKLVFFDNMYLYNPDKTGNMTEETEIAPTSRKGKVRAMIAKMITDEFNKGDLEALIARAADFYGPGIKNSLFSEVIVNNLLKGKKANWFASTDKLHNFTFTPDAAKATALLGNTNTAFNQVWHLPSSEAFTGKQWIEMVASELNVKPGVQVATKSILRILGLFNPIMREFVEMTYQYDRDYYFNSSKFEKTYGIGPTPAKEAIRQIAAFK
jgi:nucleoside-diphosphate-sugar epimerase